MKLTSERLIHAIANQIAPYESSEAINALQEREPRVILLEELLAYPVKREFNTLPYLCTEEKDVTRMWWRTWRDTSQSIICAGILGSNTYGKEWRCWTAQPTDEQRKTAKWDET